MILRTIHCRFELLAKRCAERSRRRKEADASDISCLSASSLRRLRIPQTLLALLAGLLGLALPSAAQDHSIRLSVADVVNRYFFAAGPDGERFILEWSTNLVQWTGASTNDLFGHDAPVLIHQPAFQERTFYRARRYEPPQTCNCNETVSPGAGCPVYAPPDDPAVRDAAIPNASTLVRTLRLVFHVLADNDGSNPARSDADVNAQVRTLNDHFRAHRIQFTHQISQLRHSLYRRPQSESELQDLRRTYSASPATQLNIFVTAMPGEKYGISTYPWDLAALTSDGGIVITLLRCGSGETLLTHEIGHALGLWHTHHGSDERELPSCHECWEIPGSSVASTDRTGDRCSDTPPGLLNDKGEPRGGVDPCSNAPWPVSGLRNFMSAYPAATDRFTPQQDGRMHAWINHSLAGWIDNVTPAAPSDLIATATPFGEVLLNWADNSWNETAFAVERAVGGASFGEIARAPANSTGFTDLTAPAAAVVHYRVRAFNGGTSSDYTDIVAVTTPSASADFIVDWRNTTAPFDGNESNPFQTIAQAFAEPPAGRARRITIRSGTYRTTFPANPPPSLLTPRGGTVIFEKP